MNENLSACIPGHTVLPERDRLGITSGLPVTPAQSQHAAMIGGDFYM